MIKYAANAFLALKKTFINETVNLCEAVGADVHHVAKAMGMDGRISSKFLHPGPGYGGSCFPNDAKALVQIANKIKSPMTLIEQTIKSNENQKLRMVEKIKNIIGHNLSGKTIAVLGITFKPITDDMREASSLVILPKLVELGAKIQIFDPQGEKEGRWRLKSIEESITFCIDEYKALQNADALVILTEWHQFRNLNLNKVKENMKGNHFFDFKNIYERNYIEQHGFIYDCVGR